MAMDPVCRMKVQEGELCSIYEGKKYCFCSKICKEKFEADPEKYVRKSGQVDSE